MKRFEYEETPLSGVFHIIPKSLGDSRGYFERLFSEEEFAEFGLNQKIVNINHSYTLRKGTIRGFHFQNPPYAEAKIVICIKGSVYDVAVDIRKNSPTFLEWHSQVLSADKRNMLYIPEGFAHGFQTLQEETELLYLHTQVYSKEYEGGLAYNDPAIGVSWIEEATDLSDRDKTYPYISSDFKGIEL